eukprot:10430664-Ditylum_brightwellii.AAC.1
MKKRNLNKTAYKTCMYQLCAAKIGLVELLYKDPIAIEDEESGSNKEGNEKGGKRHSNCL